MELADFTILATIILKWLLYFGGNLYTPVNTIYKKMSKIKKYEGDHRESIRDYEVRRGKASPNL
jgi:hypothetical protein